MAANRSRLTNYPRYSPIKQIIVILIQRNPNYEISKMLPLKTNKMKSDRGYELDSEDKNKTYKLDFEALDKSFQRLLAARNQDM